MAAGKLQHELKKRQPFASLAQEALLNLSRTTDRVQIQFDRLFRQHGLTPSQYNILRILRGEGKPLPILEIASRTVTVVPGITGLIDRLEQAGHVQRRRCTEDRRVVYVELQPSGLAALELLDPLVAGLEAELAQGLKADELQTLSRLLEKLRAGWPSDDSA